jgi:hypothetical protein
LFGRGGVVPLRVEFGALDVAFGHLLVGDLYALMEIAVYLASNLEARVGRCAADQLRTGQLRIIGMIADARDRRGDGPVAG